MGRKDRDVVVSVSTDPLLSSVGMDCHLESDMSPKGLCSTYYSTAGHCETNRKRGRMGEVGL